MADFLDSEAEESQEEAELDNYEKKKLKKIRAMDSDDDEDDEEDDEEKIREELKDLIDDNPIEESDGDDSDVSGGSKKRKKGSDDEDDFDDRLEDEDYDLIEENLGVKVERRKRFKRLKRFQDEESDEEKGEEKEDERDAIANELFEGSDHDDERGSERGPRMDTEHFDEEGSEGEYSETDDFIVDDDGRPITEKRRRRKVICSNAALQEAQDIFGVDFDYDEFEKYDDEYEEEDEEEDDEYIDDDEGEDAPKRRRPKKAVQKKATKTSIFEIYEPSELKRGHFTDLDHAIRVTDIPERMQLREVPVTSVPEGSDELDEEAEWIYKQAFCRPSISSQDGPRGNDNQERLKKGPATVGKIKKALDFMRNQSLEVPFIAFYRKEYVQPELNINDLWKVYKYDEKWCQLRTRKINLLKLFEKMRNYQLDQLMKAPDAPIADNVRVMKDEDIERLKSIQTVEELKDVYTHFLLYYSHDFPVMQEAWRLKQKEAAAEKKSRSKKKKRKKKKKKLVDGETGEEGVEDDGEDEENGEEDGEEEEEDGEGEDDGEEEEEEEGEDEAEDVLESETLKRAVRSGPYAICRKAGLDGLAKKFGLSPEQFAENLRDNYQRHEVEQDPVEPSDVAREYITPQFSTPDDVLRAAKFMVATQLSREPLVRRCVRETFFERAKITVRPTKKGMKEIDENHPCYSMKYVKNKPVRDLSGDQFLKLTLAEEDKLIEMKISEQIDGITSASYIEEVKQLYYRDEFSKNVQEWNALRVDCVELALTQLLLPVLRKELQARLLGEARDSVLRSCCRKLYNWLKVAPYAVEFPDEDEEEWDTGKGGTQIRVMAVAYVPDLSQAAFACLVSSDRDCSDYLRLPHLLKRKDAWREEQKAQKEADLNALRNFIGSKKPHVICVGGESREAMMVAADLREIVGLLVEDEQFPQISVEICDNELAKIYANSIKGENDFRDYPMLLRQAISIARRMQDPLMEFSQLCTSDEEILCLRYHPLQEHIPKEELLEALNLEFVNRTNEVGVDINIAVQLPYTANLVQFVCGLGPRKGQALLKALKQTNQRLENRSQLITVCHMGPKAFINCSGFIKIDTNSLGDSTEAYVEVLDGSRVHPETYEWARKMAVDALEYDDEDANPAGALEEILEAPERLKDLDLDAFAEELERQGFGNKSICLYDIRAELNHRYKDLRSPYQSPNPEQLFDMLTKETPETFFIGKLIMAIVVGITHKKPQGDQLDQANPVRNDETGLWQCPFCLKNDFPELSEVWNHFDAGACPGQATGVRLRLDNGVSGYIPVKNLSDKHVTNPEERVTWGQTIHCRITKIEVERFSIECTSKSSDLADKNNDWRPPKDPFYDVEAEDKDQKASEDANKMKQRLTYIKRVIVHPSFHNISYKEAEAIMEQMDQGEVIVRPSSKGADHLTVTWKVSDGIYQHVDVREEGKENAFSLGQSLWIGNEEFEDLDEIIARYVNPMAAHARDVLSFRYYRDTDGGSREKAEEYLKDEKRKNMSKIHYLISASKEYPGKFLLSYLPRVKVRHEYVTVAPEGFRLRQQMFDSLGSLFRWFKEHFRDPIPGTPSTPRGGTTVGGGSTGRPTPYMNTPNISIANMNPETIQRVAQNLPSHMLHSLSQAASHTPHYPHTPGGGTAGYSSAYGTYANTPYTPSGQTPFMTPYQTPHGSSQTPRYGQQTPSHHGVVGGGLTPNSSGTPFLHPGAVTPGHRTPSHRTPHHHGMHQTPSYVSQQTTPQPRSQPISSEPTDWRKAAEAWARLKQTEAGWANSISPSGSVTPRQETNRSTPRSSSGSTPRYEEGRKTPRGSNRSGMPLTPSAMAGYQSVPGSQKSPRGGSATPRSTPGGRESARSTPHTNTSPRSMVESSIGGDATPLYDEN
ncbi:transcription elongation factor SPT6 isoform X2 [Hetaerina americana]|uniref:transcription elongation factor SPT6 isoform X2 n=1 Tax=Hetaerina americana TaxID=62018 RepID=UPI003A7F1E28